MKRIGYKERLVDDKISKYLTVFGAICIQGPKWCGKSWAALNHSQSETLMTEKENIDIAMFNPKYIFKDERPQLIDEWQIVPSIWDAVRNECDKDLNKGKFILTGSTSLEKQIAEQEIHHTGTRRIANIKMMPMSLYESGDSSGEISIMDMYNNIDIFKNVKRLELNDIINLIIRGGWPANIDTPIENIDILPKAYIDSIIEKDINERKNIKRDSQKMRMLIKSLARNEGTIAGISKIVRDLSQNEELDYVLKTRTTVGEYIGVLENLFVIENQPAFDINYRSSKRVGKTAKRHFVDPSLACAALNLTQEKLLKNHETLGFMFEALVERDLKIYMDYLEGNLYHFRDNVSGDEVDAIIEFKDGEYGAIAIKLSQNSIEDAKNSLMKFYSNVKIKPKFMAIIVSSYGNIIKDKETGIYILPINALKP